MKILNNNIKWIMLVSGVVTCSMVYAAISPQQALQATFASSLQGPLAELVVRSWGFLITLIGAMLIYGAYKPIYRPLILSVAGLSKLFFIALVVAYGYAGNAMLTVVFDSLMAVIYFLHLATHVRTMEPHEA